MPSTTNEASCMSSPQSPTGESADSATWSTDADSSKAALDQTSNNSDTSISTNNETTMNSSLAAPPPPSDSPSEAAVPLILLDAGVEAPLILANDELDLLIKMELANK